MIYYCLTHFFITAKPEHFHYFDIGIYESKEKANDALNQLKDKPGFSIRPMLSEFVRSSDLELLDS